MMIPKPQPSSDIPSEIPSEWDDPTPLELEDDRWDAFLPDGGQEDRLPEPGDFWIEFDGVRESFVNCLSSPCLN